MMTRNIRLSVIIVALSLVLAGCAGVGPRTILRDRSDYTAAISDSWKHQMLTNMVKIRYGDAPVFLDVSSVISQYQVGREVNLGATFENNPWTTTQSLGIKGQYIDRPTITFTPILGDKFARSLMTPVPPSAILSLIQAGYPVDLVFRMLVQEINGIRNRFGGDARMETADPSFYALIEKMRQIQMRGAIGLRVSKIDKKEAAVIVFRGKRDPAIDLLSAEVRRMLDLDPQATEFNVTYGAIPRNDKEVALLTRSFLEVIIDLSADIEVPATHVTEKRVGPSHVEIRTGGEKVIPLIRVRNSFEIPGDAFVSVPYRNTYFWIDDRDLMSKKIFSFLLFVLTLVETGEKGMTPIVTVPTN